MTSRLHKGEFINECMHDSARKAIKEGKIFNYYLFWSKEPIGWQKKAKKILREELHSAAIRHAS